MHQSEFTFEASLPVGTPLDQTISILDGVEKSILENKKELGIDTLLVMYGFDTTNMKRSDEGEHSAIFKVLLKETDTGFLRQLLNLLQNKKQPESYHYRWELISEYACLP